MIGSNEKARSLKVLTPILIGVVGLAILVGVLGVWSVQARIGGAVIASGMIEVQSNRQVLQHPHGGVISELLVKDGDAVQPGDVVLRFEDKQIRFDLAIIERQLFEVLARIARLEAERDGLARLKISGLLAEFAQQNPTVQALVDGQVHLFQVRAASLKQGYQQVSEQIAQAKNQIAGSNAQLSALNTQRELIETELVDSQSLFNRGLIAAPHVLSLQREQARLLGEIGTVTSGIAQIRGQIAGLKIERLALTTQLREQAISELRDLRLQEVELEQRRQSILTRLSRMELRTPVGGIIYGLTVFALQSVVSPAAPIMYVIPQDQPLVISVRVEPIHIDQLHLGQSANLRFAALDQRLTPEVSGRVTHISADVYTDEITGSSYYLIKLIPAADEIGKLGGQTLLPGMPVDAFIKTAERSPLSYLVKPITDYFVRAFRDE